MDEAIEQGAATVGAVTTDATGRWPRVGWFSLLLSSVLCSSAASQVILRQPTQILDDPLAVHQARVGSVVAVDGDALLVANTLGAPFSAGYLMSYAQTQSGYEFVERVSPQACFSGPSSPPVTWSGTNGCGFPASLQVVDDIAVAISYGGDFLGGSTALGLVHVLQRVQERWIPVQYLRGFADPSGTATGYWSLVCYDGTTIAVRMSVYEVPGEVLRGAVALYERNAAGLFERVAIVRPAATSGGPPPGSNSTWDTAGMIALHNGVLALSEWHHTVERVRIYERFAPGDWQETAVIERTPFAGVFFGHQLALDGESGVLAISEHAGEGQVWVYERDTVTRQWAPAATLGLGPLEGSTLPGLSALFGWRVRVRGDVVAVGAPRGSIQGQSTGTVEVYRRGPQGWVRERRVAPPVAPGPIPQSFGRALDLADGRLLVGAEGYGTGPGNYTGRAYLYQLTEGTLACAGPGNTADLHALFDDERDGRMQLSAFGLNGGGLGYFVAGPASGATPFGASELCVGGPRRISGPLAFPATADRVYAHVQHPDPTSPTSTAFQFVYRTTGSATTQASVARIVD